MDARIIAGFSLGPIISGTLGVITLPVLAWSFSAEDIGRLSMLQLLTTLSVVIFGLGMDQAYVRDFHEVADESKPRLLIAAALPGVFVCACSAAMLTLYSPTLLATLAFDSASVSWTIGLLAAAHIALISRFLSLVLRMREQGLAFSLSQSLPKLLFLVASLVAWALNVGSFDLLLSANVATLAIVLLAFGYYSRSAWIPGISRAIDWTAMRRMFVFGAPLVFGGLASWTVMTQDKLLLRHYSTMDELGVYSVAASLASAVGVGTVLFTTIWIPTVYKWHAQGDAWLRVQAAARHATAACCFAIAGAGVVSPAAELILPDRYALVRSLIPACVTLPMFYALSEATAVGLGLGRKSIYSMVASLVGAGAGCIVGVFLIPPLGARGASIAAVAAASTFVIARTEFAHRMWRPMSRNSVYVPVLVMSVSVSLYSLFDDDVFGYWPLIWITLLIGCAGVYRQSLDKARTALLAVVRESRGSKSAHRSL